MELVGLEGVYPVHQVGYCRRCPDETHVCHKGKLVVKQLVVVITQCIFAGCRVCVVVCFYFLCVRVCILMCVTPKEKCLLVCGDDSGCIIEKMVLWHQVAVSLDNASC